MKNNWLKLYHEILTDPKMGKMSDHLYRRTIEIFLIAGQEERDGYLPSINDMAWLLRTNATDIKKVLDELQTLGIVSCDCSESGQGGYYVTHFVERQSQQLSDAERAKKYRDNKKASRNLSDERSENVTIDKRREDIEKIRKDKEEIREREDKTENVTQASRSPKHRHGNFSHVLLTDEEVDRLSADYGYDVMLMYIQKLDDYLENNPSKHYANHNLTIRNWIKKDAENVKTLPKPQQKAIDYAEFGRMLDEQERNVIDL